MDVNQLSKDKKRFETSKIKSIISVFIIIFFILPSISVQADINKDRNYFDAYWKHYPYHQPGTEIIFPVDEGSHETSEFPIEWWYVNFHLIGQTTGNEYGSFVAFYKIELPIAEKKEVRIFSISDLASEKTYTNVQIGVLTASTDHLDLSFEYITNDITPDNIIESNVYIENIISQNQETLNTQDSTSKSMNQTTLGSSSFNDDIEKSNLINQEFASQESSDGYIHSDHWYTKYNDQGLLPFQYILDISGNSQQDNQVMSIVVDMDCMKKPLIVGGDGYIRYQDSKYSYYYSLTRVSVSGTIIIHGVMEEIVGYAWIDHQWGNFIIQNPPPFGLPMTYEWFSIQLDDNRDIVVGDMWNRETGEKIDASFTDGLNIINDDGSLELLHEYTITPLRFWNESFSNHFYSCQWRITEESMSMDLIVVPIYLDQMMRFKENSPLLQQFLESLFPSACFWEGNCRISGTIDGKPVNGKSYVELTHYYNSVRE